MDYLVRSGWGKKCYCCEGWKGEFNLLQLEVHECPESCEARHLTFMIVFLNFGFKMELQYPRPKVEPPNATFNNV